jgi:hypothetical protein
MFPDHAPGSDESLGGALLTPIPWLTGASSPDNDGGATLSEGNAFSSLSPYIAVNTRSS